MCDIPPQTYESMSSPLETGDLPAVAVNQEASFEPIREAVLDLRERVEDMCNQELGKITKQGSAAKALLVLPAYLFTAHLSLSYCLFFSVNDTILFTLGDCKFQILLFLCCSFKPVTFQ